MTFHANRYDAIEWWCGKRDELCGSPDHDFIGGDGPPDAEQIRDVDCEDCLRAIEAVGKAANRQLGHLMIMRHKAQRF